MRFFTVANLMGTSSIYQELNLAPTERSDEEDVINQNQTVVMWLIK